MIATRFVAGVAWLPLSATALGNQGMMCEGRTIMASPDIVYVWGWTKPAIKMARVEHSGNTKAHGCGEMAGCESAGKPALTRLTMQSFRTRFRDGIHTST